MCRVSCMCCVPIASRWCRAPAAALYEAGRVHHCGVFPELEDQMCSYDGTSSKSPDRMDALVWALSHLFDAKGAGPRIRKI